jgi:hypothetical protein
MLPNNNSPELPPAEEAASPNNAVRAHHYHFAIKTDDLGERYVAITQTTSDGNSRSTKCIDVFAREIGAVYSAFSKVAKQLQPSLKTLDLHEIRKESPRAFTPWTHQEDQRLTEESQRGASIGELAKAFGRKPGAIRARLKLLGLYIA